MPGYVDDRPRKRKRAARGVRFAGFAASAALFLAMIPCKELFNALVKGRLSDFSGTGVGLALMLSLALFLLSRVIAFVASCERDRLRVTGHHCVNWICQQWVPIVLLFVFSMLISGAYATHVFWFHWSIPGEAFFIFGFVLLAMLLGAYYLVLAYGRHNIDVLLHRMVDEAKKLIHVYGIEADKDKEIHSAIESQTGLDIICVSAVHFDRLLRQDALLKQIRRQNPNAEVYYMPEFPFCWHIIERATLLRLSHQVDYVDCLSTAIRKVRRYLDARVKLRHYPPEFRMLLWAKLDRVKLDKTRDYDTTPPEKLRAAVVDGGMCLQPYRRPRIEACHEDLLVGSLREWGCLMLQMVEWFFYEWTESSRPSLSKVISHKPSAIAVARSIGIREGRSNKLFERYALGRRLKKYPGLEKFYTNANLDLNSSA